MTITIEAGTLFNDPGVRAGDDRDGDLSDIVFLDNSLPKSGLVLHLTLLISTGSVMEINSVLGQMAVLMDLFSMLPPRPQLSRSLVSEASLLLASRAQRL